MSPNSGKFIFSLRKKEKHEHRFFYIHDVLPSTYAHSYLLTNLEAPDFSSNSGGAIGTNSVRIKLDVIERIVWDNLGNKIIDILNKSNIDFLKHEIADVAIGEDISCPNFFQILVVY